MHFLTLFLLLILPLSYTGCANKNSEVDNRISPPVELPKVVDTLSNNGSFYTADSMQSAWYRVEGVGCLDSNKIDISKEWWNEEDNNIAETDIAMNAKIHLVIDTTQSIIKKVTEYRTIALPENFDNDIEHFYKAYPVYIVNSSDSVSYLEIQDASLIMIQEAKNQKGEWRPIEYWTYSSCGNSYYEILIKPNYFTLAKVPIYKGDFETELRVKLLSNKTIYYSNSYWGSINLAQLKPIVSEEKSWHSFLNMK